MTQLERWLLHVSNVLVGGTGIAYAVMLYTMRPTDEFAVANHPLQPHVQHLHVLAAPLLVFAMGLIWSTHVAKHLRERGRPRPRHAWPLLVSSGPMIASGYLIQIATGDAWRKAWVAVHVVSSGLWLGAYLVHVLLPRLGRGSGRLRVPRASANPQAETVDRRRAATT